MNIYIERNLLNNNIAKNIIKSYKNPNILLIDNYKNIFDKKIHWKIVKSIIIASVSNSILKAPEW